MPVKTHKGQSKKVPKHYAKVYWPYLPLIIIVLAGLWLGRPGVDRSQRGTVDYATNVSSTELLQSTNQIRQSRGDAPLVANDLLSKAATAKANDMVKHNYWVYDGQEDKSPLAFAAKNGYQAATIKETLAYGFNSSQQTIKGWLNSSEHRTSLLNPNYQQVGFGVAKSDNFIKTGPETIIVAFFAQPLAVNSQPQAASANASIAGALGSTTTISRIQTMTNGRAPWIGAALGILAIIGLAYLFIKNILHWRFSRKKGQKFSFKNPIFDLTIIAFAALVALLCQGVGYIR